MAQKNGTYDPTLILKSSTDIGITWIYRDCDLWYGKFPPTINNCNNEYDLIANQFGKTPTTSEHAVL